MEWKDWEEEGEGRGGEKRGRGGEGRGGGGSVVSTEGRGTYPRAQNSLATSMLCALALMRPRAEVTRGVWGERRRGRREDTPPLDRNWPRATVSVAIAASASAADVWTVTSENSKQETSAGMTSDPNSSSL